MRKMLTAMALIALVMPVLMDRANAATVINSTLATINQIDITNHNTVNVVAVGVIDTKQLVGESRLTDLVATKSKNGTLIKKGKDVVLLSHEVKEWGNRTLALREGQPSLSVDYERNNRPLPATRGKPIDNMLSGSLLASAIGELRSPVTLVPRGGGNLLLLDATLTVPSDVSRPLSLGNQEGVTRELLLSLGGVDNGGVIGALTTQQLSSV